MRLFDIHDLCIARVNRTVKRNGNETSNTRTHLTKQGGNFRKPQAKFIFTIAISSNFYYRGQAINGTQLNIFNWAGIIWSQKEAIFDFS